MSQVKEYTVDCPYCDKPMKEIWQLFFDADDNDAEGLVGYECTHCNLHCDLKFNTKGEEVS